MWDISLPLSSQTHTYVIHWCANLLIWGRGLRDDSRNAAHKGKSMEMFKGTVGGGATPTRQSINAHNRRHCRHHRHCHFDGRLSFQSLLLPFMIITDYFSCYLVLHLHINQGPFEIHFRGPCPIKGPLEGSEAKFSLFQRQLFFTS